MMFWNGSVRSVMALCTGMAAMAGCAAVPHAKLHEGRTQTTVYVAPSSSGGSDSHPGTLHEPFMTLERAKQAIRETKGSWSGDAIVYLREGLYELDAPVVFEANDSGHDGYRVKYMAYPGEHPVITGGKRVSGWVPAENGLYKADSHGRQFRQLYVNGQSGIRARTPNVGSIYRLRYWDESGRTLVVAGSELPNLGDIRGVELIVHKEWTQNNLRLALFTVDGPEARLIPLEPDRTKAFSSHGFLRKREQPYYLENAYEFLDAEGEWYVSLATNEVFYKPRAGEDLSTAVVIVPMLVELVRLQGTPRRPVMNIEFHGLAFEYSAWLEPSEEGFATGQADSILTNGSDRNHQVPGAIHVQDAENIRFEGNAFRNLGATAVTFWSGVRHSALVGNAFRDISATGISIGMDLDQHPADAGHVCRDNVIKDNLITKIGRDYHSSVGIFAGYTEGLAIENNELADMPYTGISVGWGWTLEATPLKNNLIRRNRIHNVMRLLADGAGIYMLSRQPGTQLVENYIFNIARSPSAGEHLVSAIYLDEGSSQIRLADNLLENVPIGIVFHRAEHNTVINNMAPFQGLGGSSYNEVIRSGFPDPDRIRANAGRSRSGPAEGAGRPHQPE